MGDDGSRVAEIADLPSSAAAFAAQFGPSASASFDDAPQKPQAGFIGRDLDGNVPPIHVFGGRPASAEHPFRVVSYYTEDNAYAEHAARLRATLERWNIDHRLIPIPSVGAWERNCNLKPRVIQVEWEESDAPIVWIDADATVESFPDLFSRLDCDLAVHKWDGWQFGSGTLYFGKTRLAKVFIDHWLLRCRADPLTWDQSHLQSAWCDINTITPFRTVWLPRSYLQIFDARAKEPAVIQHWQASRVEKREGRTEASSEPTVSGHGKALRRSNQLWRSAEEIVWILEGIRHLRPADEEVFPGNAAVKAALLEAVDGRFPLVEIGGGGGGIAALFDPAQYIGMDINPSALLLARERLPGHTFRIIDEGQEYPRAGAILFHDVLRHVPDDLAAHMIGMARAASDRVIVAETMDDAPPPDEGPKVFARTAADYVRIAESRGLSLIKSQELVPERRERDAAAGATAARLVVLTFGKAAGAV